jgi:hypothetical protein
LGIGRAWGSGPSHMYSCLCCFLHQLKSLFLTQKSCFFCQVKLWLASRVKSQILLRFLLSITTTSVLLLCIYICKWHRCVIFPHAFCWVIAAMLMLKGINKLSIFLCAETTYMVCKLGLKNSHTAKIVLT